MGGDSMQEHDMKSLMQKGSFELATKIQVQKLQYVMDFGDVSVQYDFCLN